MAFITHLSLFASVLLNISLLTSLITMDDIRKLVKRNTTPTMALQTLRTALMMPPPVARAVINDLTRPLGDQKRFIRHFDNEHWKGALIMSEMIRCDDETALKRLKKADIVIFEVHGGGFRTGNCTMFMDSFVSWLRMIKSKHNLYACIMSVDYALAPKHKYPAPLRDCAKAYDYLTNHLGVSPSKIIMSGDSAGGALAIETLVHTYSPRILEDLSAPRDNYSIPMCAGMLLSSPLVTATTTSESFQKFHKTDVVSMNLANLIFREYLGMPQVKLEDVPIARLGHIKKDFDRFLPKQVLVFIGGKETLLSDVVDMVEAIKQDGKINVQLVSENYPHDWFLIHELIKKKDKPLIAKYNEMFVDFAVKAVQEAQQVGGDRKVSPHKRPSRLDSSLESSQSTFAVNESIDVAHLIDEKIRNGIPLLATYDEETQPDIKQEHLKEKPNTVLSEYAVVTDSPSSKVISI